MVKIDLKDRKILYQLDLNCRQSNTQIGKKVGLSKKVVGYRIHRMQSEGVITHFWTAINTYKLGYYYVFRIYINLIDISPKIKTEIIQYFVENKDSWAVITSKGPIDLDVVLWVNDVYEFNRYWVNTLQTYGKYFAKSTISILTEVISCKKSYLLDEGDDSSSRFFYKANCRGEPLQIDEVDYKILDELALNARIPFIDLAEKLNCSPQTIDYRVKNLMKKGIIQAFRVAIEPSKLGLQECAVDIYLKDQTKRNQIIDYLIKMPNVYDIMSMNIGWSDLQFQAVINNINEITLLTENIEKKFPNAVRRCDYWVSETTHKERWLPEMTEADFKKIKSKRNLNK